MLSSSLPQEHLHSFIPFTDNLWHGVFFVFPADFDLDSLRKEHRDSSPSETDHSLEQFYSTCLSRSGVCLYFAVLELFTVRKDRHYENRSTQWSSHLIPGQPFLSVSVKLLLMFKISWELLAVWYKPLPSKIRSKQFYYHICPYCFRLPFNLRYFSCSWWSLFHYKHLWTEVPRRALHYHTFFIFIVTKTHPKITSLNFSPDDSTQHYFAFFPWCPSEEQSGN